MDEQTKTRCSRGFRLMLATMCAAGVMSGSASAQTYTVTDLATLGTSSAGVAINADGQVAGQFRTAGVDGTFAFLFSGGVTTDLGNLGGRYTYPYAINAAGQVVGSSDAPDGSPNAFLYSNGVMTNLGALPGGSAAIALGINDAGQVTGLAGAEASLTRAFLYSNGVMTDLGTLGGGYSAGAAINAAGQVTGISSIWGNTQDHAFLYSKGTMTDLGTFGGTQSLGVAINAAGQVTGYSYFAGNTARHAFLAGNGVVTDLGTLGGTNSEPAGINAAGQVTGYAYTVGDTEKHGFLYGGGVMVDLGMLGGGYSEGLAINAAGQVVGASNTASFATHAFLYRGATLIDLNTVIPSDSGWTLIRANAINDGGQITGVGFVNGQPHAFLLTPIGARQAHVQQPIDADGSSVFAAKRGVIPVKFGITVDGTPSCQLPPATIALTRTLGGTIGPIDQGIYSGPADDGSNFRIADCQYAYNLAASSLGTGHYRVEIAIEGSVVGHAEFSLR